MNTLNNLAVIPKRPSNARSRMEAIAQDGRITIVYNDSIQQLLRIALGLKAEQITITTMH